MLCTALRHTGAYLGSRLLPSIPTHAPLLATRGIRLFDIFDKTKIKERQQQLKEEASRGYWDDFKELRDSKGKLYSASRVLIPAKSAWAVPTVQLLDQSSLLTTIPAEVQNFKVTLLCIAFRRGAEAMLASWSNPFSSQFASQGIIDLSIVDSKVMSLWPFKQMMLRGRSADAEKDPQRRKFLYHFGTETPIIEALNLSNKLTGYVFLLDSVGRIRWRGSGAASPEELDAFLQSAQQLVEQESK